MDPNIPILIHLYEIYIINLAFFVYSIDLNINYIIYI